MDSIAVDFLAMDPAIRAVILGGTFLISLAVSLWLFYDAQGRGSRDLTAKALVSVGTVITLPALVISAFNLDVDRQGLVNPLSYAALGGAALTLVSSVCYLVFSRRPVRYDEAPPVQGARVVEEPTDLRPREPEPTKIGYVNERQTLAFVVEKTGHHPGRIHRLDERTVVGRDERCDIMLDDEKVSREHVSIRFQDNRFTMRDLDSRNGTWLENGDQAVRVESPHVLSEHDRILVGSTILVFTQISDGTGSGDARH